MSEIQEGLTIETILTKSRRITQPIMRTAISSCDASTNRFIKRNWQWFGSVSIIVVKGTYNGTLWVQYKGCEYVTPLEKSDLLVCKVQDPDVNEMSIIESRKLELETIVPKVGNSLYHPHVLGFDDHYLLGIVRRRKFSSKALSEFRLRFYAFPEHKLRHVIMWTLSMHGISVVIESNLSSLLKRLVVVEELQGKPLFCPTVEEYTNCQSRKLSLLEQQSRECILHQEEANLQQLEEEVDNLRKVHHLQKQKQRMQCRQKISEITSNDEKPFFGEAAVSKMIDQVSVLSPTGISPKHNILSMTRVRRLRSAWRPSITNADEEIPSRRRSTVMGTVYPMHFKLNDLQTSLTTNKNIIIFTLLDRSTVSLNTIFDTKLFGYSSGDVLEYTTGDISGRRCIIIGTYNNLLYRYEYQGPSGPFPFKGGNYDEINDMHRLKVIETGKAIPVCSAFHFVTHFGDVVVFDTSDDACEKFSVIHGQRYFCHDGPCCGRTITIIGTLPDVDGSKYIWVAENWSGAYPLTLESNGISTSGDIFKEHGLEMLFYSKVPPWTSDSPCMRYGYKCVDISSLAHKRFNISRGTRFQISGHVAVVLGVHKASLLYCYVGDTNRVFSLSKEEVTQLKIINTTKTAPSGNQISSQMEEYRGGASRSFRFLGSGNHVNLFDTRDETVRTFGLRHGQRIRTTNSNRESSLSTIIGVRNGLIWRQVDGDLHATACNGAQGEKDIQSMWSPQSIGFVKVTEFMG